MMNGWAKRFLQIALLALVLASQTFAHAHATDHGGPFGKTQCPVCSVSQPSGQAAIDSGGDDHEQPPCPPAFAAVTPPAGTTPLPALKARAPPLPR